MEKSMERILAKHACICHALTVVARCAIQPRPVMIRPRSNHPPTLMQQRRTATQALCIAVALWCLAGMGDGVSHAAKAKAKAHPPDLRILSVDPTPLPFVVTERPLTLTIMVELPKTLPEEALLNVTTLITSLSKSSIRVLESLQPLTDKTVTDAAIENGSPRRIEVVQVWDGTDQTKRVVSDGTYNYQVVAKLMAPGKNGPLTRETSWKRRGSFEVRER